MSRSYFKDLRENSEGRLWINNPSLEELGLALDEGAVGCTTNPAFCSKLIHAENNYLDRLIDNALQESSDINEAALLTYRLAAKNLMREFEPLHRESNGIHGYVTIQDNPQYDEDPVKIIENIVTCQKLGINYMAKIPVIPGGIEAIEYCVERNVPVCATEIFSISQAMDVCRRYSEAAERSGKHPPFYLTHITGIFDEYLEKTVARTGVSIEPSILRQAGLIVARKQYQLLKANCNDAIMLGGGARRKDHFTGLMGGDVHVTVNWSTVQDILDSNIEFTNEIETPSDDHVVKELLEKIPDFRKAYDEDGLRLEEFSTFGPVQLFRNSFLQGWYQLLAQIATRKVTLAI